MVPYLTIANHLLFSVTVTTGSPSAKSDETNVVAIVVGVVVPIVVIVAVAVAIIVYCKFKQKPANSRKYHNNEIL